MFIRFLQRIKPFVPTFVQTGFHRLRYLVGSRGQSDEGAILDRLVKAIGVAGAFVEFGFHPSEFNCSRLSRRSPGMLIDMDAKTVALGRRILPSRLDIRHEYLDAQTLDTPRRFLREHPGAVLSIDVDGNDYWLLGALLGERPAIVAVEYNASFGLRSVTVPYDPQFSRMEKHSTGWFHGASLTALAALCRCHGYDLVAVSRGGVNAFFVRGDLNVLPALTPERAYRESALRNKWSGLNADQQWRVLDEAGMTARLQTPLLPGGLEPPLDSAGGAA